MVSSLRFISLGLLFVGSNGVRCKDQITCEAPESVGTLQAGFERFDEASSLALSTDKKYLYTANDSGTEKAEIFAINKNNGQVAKVFSIKGIRNERHGGGGGWGDFECMTVNDCPHDQAKKCIYLGDTGYNWVRMKVGKERSYPQSFIVFEEPEITSSDGKELVVDARRFPFTFPDKQLFDVEACTVKDSLIHLFTKNSPAYTEHKYQYSHMFTYQPPVEENPTTKTAPVVELKPDSDNVPLFIQFGEISGATTTDNKSFILRTSKGLFILDPTSAPTCKSQEKSLEPCYLNLKRGVLEGIQEAVAYENQDGQHVLYTYGEGSRELYKTICSGKFFDDGHAKSECHNAPSPDGAKESQRHGTLPRPYQDDDEGSDNTRPGAGGNSGRQNGQMSRQDGKGKKKKDRGGQTMTIRKPDIPRLITLALKSVLQKYAQDNKMIDQIWNRAQNELGE